MSNVPRNGNRTSHLPAAGRRKRKMVFTEIMYFMLSKVKESTQNVLERIFPQLKKENLRMSRQAFSAARQKIKWEAFEELFQTSVIGSYQEDW